MSTKVSDIERNSEGKLTINAEGGRSWECDAVIVTSQPTQALPILDGIAPKRLTHELEKWDQMDCYVLFHTDFSDIGKKPWLHQTHRNENTGKLYITNTIKPRMGDLDAKYLITFVYNTENYLDFIANHMDESTVVKLYEPKLPIFNLDNSVNRNSVWREIDAQCNDVFWTQACRSGLQYHNNGILSAKRVVRRVLGQKW
jgi:predicted NAD/FAD-binding protein